jgi:hypothetical protein
MLFANNCNTTLSSSLTSGATSMSVTSATGFPSPTGVQYFYCTLADAATQTTIEIVKVTAVSGTTFTIVRGQDGTTGTIFASGAVVSLRLVRASLNDFPKLDEVNTFSQAQTFSAAPITSTLTGFVYGNGASAQTVATTAQALSLIGTLPVANGGTGTTTSTGTGSVVLGTRPTMSVTGAGFTLQDATDNTKQANFVLSGLTTGTNYTYALPATTGSTIALLSGVQTFTSTTTFSSTFSVTNGQIILGNNTGSQQVDLGVGATTSGRTKTINIGTGGLTGSTTTMAIGSTFGTTVTCNGTWNYSTAIGVASGGTGLTSLTAGYIPYGNGTSAFSSSSSLYFSGTNLGVGTSSPTSTLDVNGCIRAIANITPTSGAGLELVYNAGDSSYITSYNRTSSAWLNLTINSLSTRFGINGAEVARFDTSGNLLVGTTSTLGSSLCTLMNNGQYAGPQLVIRNNYNTAGKYWKIGQENNNSLAFYIYSATGVGQYMQDGGTSWLPNVSDERLKNKVLDISDALEAVNKLKPVSFYYKNQPQLGTPNYGHFAQDVGNAIPDAMLVSPQTDETLGEIYTYDPNIINVYLVAAINELTAKLKSAGVAGF